ncbi:hypothetical protein ABG067_009488, partial [Albugo candida]
VKYACTLPFTVKETFKTIIPFADDFPALAATLPFAATSWTYDGPMDIDSLSLAAAILEKQ